MRPDGKACARCRDSVTPCDDHMGNVYDWLVSKGWDEQAMIEYCLNRHLALNRDNGNKKLGILPTRRYASNLDRHDEAVRKAKERIK